jgi:stage II sporulation protein D
MSRRRGLVVPALVAAAGLAVTLLLPRTGLSSSWAAPVAGAAATSSGSASASGRVPATFVLGGGGYGHGVGMSQYGAQAQALAARSAATILATYYRGTSLTTAHDSADIRVQVLGRRASTRITTSAVDELGGRFVVAAGRRSLLGRAGDTLTVTTTSTGVRAALTHAGHTTSLSGARIVVRWQGTRAMSGPATLVHLSGAAAVYRRGRLEISKVLGLVNVVNVLRLHDEYLNGIDEVPASWRPAALQAQAMAARTYAIKALAGGISRWCDCQVYDDTRSQVFHGWSREGQPTSGARWSAAVRATAPSATTGRIITYGGKPIDAVYFSSDGGRTENSEDVWANPVPYLRSVPDPWSAGGGNPLGRWSRTRSQAQVAAAFGLPDVASLDLSARTAGGGVVTAAATSSTGKIARISGRSLVSRLGLPAWWVSRSATRIAGTAAWDTVLAAAAPLGADGTVVVAGGAPLTAEAAVAAPLARHLRAPLLLVARDAVPASVAAWFKKRHVTKVIVVGGTDTVADATLASLAQLAGTGATVGRVAGADRYATSALVARQIGAAAGFAVVAAGDDAQLPVTVAAAAGAAAGDRPLLLVSPEGVPAPVAQALTDLHVRGTTCVGSADAIPETTRTTLPGCARVTGPDPAATAAALVPTFERTARPSTLAVAATAPTRLTDAVVAAGRGMLVVYAGTTVPASTLAALRATASVGSVTVFGSASGVSAAAVTALRFA